MDADEIKEIEDVLKICINLSDFNKRLKLNIDEFTYIYEQLVLNDSNISFTSRQNLITINNNKIIESNYRYMLGIQYKDIKSFGFSEVEEDILLMKCRELDSFRDYDISDFEICERAKKCGVNVIYTDDIIKGLMITYIKSLKILSIDRITLINILKSSKLFDDLEDVYLIELAKISGIQII